MERRRSPRHRLHFCRRVVDLTIADGGLVIADDTGIVADCIFNLGSGALAGMLDTATISNDGAIFADFTNTLTLAADISESGTLTKAGIGTLILTGINTYTGATTVNGGILRVDGAITGSVVSVSSGGTLGGNGNIGVVTVAGGGTLAPGASAGILNTSNISLASGAAFAVELGGLNPGAGGYDRLKANGTVALGGSTLV